MILSAFGRFTYVCALALLLVELTANLAVANSCEVAWSERSTPFANLPQRGSEPWQLLAQQMAAGLDIHSGPGYAILDLKPYLSVQDFEAFLALAPSRRSADKPLRMPTIRVRDRRFLESNILNIRQNEAMKRLMEWIGDLTFPALDPMELKGTLLGELRESTPKSPGSVVNEWHIDGTTNLALILVIRGPGTLIAPSAPKMTYIEAQRFGRNNRNLHGDEVPVGSLIVMSAQSRGRLFPNVKPLLHRSPDDLGPDRMILLLRHQTEIIGPSGQMMDF